jgi:hypothetical protein
MPDKKVVKKLVLGINTRFAVSNPFDPRYTNLNYVQIEKRVFEGRGRKVGSIDWDECAKAYLIIRTVRCILYAIAAQCIPSPACY